MENVLGILEGLKLSVEVDSLVVAWDISLREVGLGVGLYGSFVDVASLLDRFSLKG